MNNHIQKFTAVAAAVTAVTASVVALSGGFGRPAAAQGRSGGGDARAAAIGGVDLQRVFNEYKGKQSAQQDIQGMEQGLNKVIQRLDEASATFLPDKEVRELADLYAKAGATPGDKQRIEALESKAKALGDELRTLQNEKSPSPAQQARLSELMSAGQKGTGMLDQVRQTMLTQLQQKNAALTQKITGEMKTAVAKVAQDKNLSVVFDSNVAVYTSNDITSDVIKHLNK